MEALGIICKDSITAFIYLKTFEIKDFDINCKEGKMRGLKGI
jgi:hypothetical protein